MILEPSDSQQIIFRTLQEEDVSYSSSASDLSAGDSPTYCPRSQHYDPYFSDRDSRHRSHSKHKDFRQDPLVWNHTPWPPANYLYSSHSWPYWLPWKVQHARKPGSPVPSRVSLVPQEFIRSHFEYPHATTLHLFPLIQDLLPPWDLNTVLKGLIGPLRHHF